MNPIRWMGLSWAQWAKPFLIGVSAFVVIPLVAKWLGYSAGTAILWATGVVILLYTIETHEMRLEMVRANKMAVQPLLVTSIEKAELAEGVSMVVKNIGKGPALRVQIEDIEHQIGEPIDGTRYRILTRFFTVDCLEAGATEMVIPRFGLEDRTGFQAKDYWIAALNPHTARENFTITVTYEDMSGRTHKSEMQMGKDGTRLLR